MEGMRGQDRQDDVSLDMNKLTAKLNANSLGGMPPMLKFLVAERRLKTFGALLGALDASENWNSAGNFEIKSTNIARSVAIIGSHPLNPHPKNHYDVTAGYIIELLKPIIEATRDEMLEEKSPEEDEGN